MESFESTSEESENRRRESTEGMPYRTADRCDEHRTRGDQGLGLAVLIMLLLVLGLLGRWLHDF